MLKSTYWVHEYLLLCNTGCCFWFDYTGISRLYVKSISRAVFIYINSNTCWIPTCDKIFHFLLYALHFGNKNLAFVWNSVFQILYLLICRSQVFFVVFSQLKVCVLEYKFPDLSFQNTSLTRLFCLSNA